MPGGDGLVLEGAQERGSRPGAAGVALDRDGHLGDRATGLVA